MKQNGSTIHFVREVKAGNAITQGFFRLTIFTVSPFQRDTFEKVERQQIQSTPRIFVLRLTTIINPALLNYRNPVDNQFILLVITCPKRVHGARRRGDDK